MDLVFRPYKQAYKNMTVFFFSSYFWKMSTVKGDPILISAVPLPDTDLPPRYEDYEEKTSLTINFDNGEN